MRPEITKEVDSTTGEHVSKCPITDIQKKALADVLAQHNAKLNNFMILSQQYADLQCKWTDLRKDLTKTDEKFKSKMKYIAKKLKLSENEPWTYNMQEGCFELREPPELEPKTANQMGVGEKVGAGLGT